MLGEAKSELFGSIRSSGRSIPLNLVNHSMRACSLADSNVHVASITSASEPAASSRSCIEVRDPAACVPADRRGQARKERGYSRQSVVFITRMYLCIGHVLLTRCHRPQSPPSAFRLHASPLDPWAWNTQLQMPQEILSSLEASERWKARALMPPSRES